MLTRQQAPASRAEVTAPRQAWIDNLRVAVVVGVIASHVAIIYVLDVGWYYEERSLRGLARPSPRP